jgi:phage terminase large subunit-like protein
MMPWQRHVVEVGLEINPDTGQLAYREVVVTVPRQNGKSTLLLGVQCARCLMWGKPQNVAYTAQTGLDGRMKFLDDQVPVIQGSILNLSVDRIYRAAHNTALTWKNGSRISVLSTGEKSGHGKTLDLAVIDEAFADADNRREQALLPTMATRESPQLWNVSTAGTPASTYLRRKVEVGRAAVAADRREGVAYFEWSVPDEEDVDDPAVWAEYMPAYGITITEETVKHARQTMTDGDFRRAFGNQWTETEDRIIPADWWNQVSKPGQDFDSDLYAIHGLEDRSMSAVCKADRSGNVRLVAQRKGTGWHVEAFAKLSNPKVVVAKSGPVSPVGDDLERAGVKVVWVDSLGVRKACSRFYDGVADQKMFVRSDERFDKAVASAARRHADGLWQWNNDAPGSDILTAGSLAYDAALDSELVPFFL